MNWSKETARDLIALGSIPFYLLVILRAIIGKSHEFVAQLTIAFVVFLLLTRLMKKTDWHVALSFILLIFISLFYKESLFTLGAGIVWIAIIISAASLSSKKEGIFTGILVGALSAGVGYFLTTYLPLLV